MMKRGKGEKEIEKLRSHIDLIDTKLYIIFVERMKLVERLGRIKQREGVSIHQPQREKEIVGRLYLKKGLERGFVRRMWSLLFSEARKVQGREWRR